MTNAEAMQAGADALRHLEQTARVAGNPEQASRYHNAAHVLEHFAQVWTAFISNSWTWSQISDEVRKREENTR